MKATELQIGDWVNLSDVPDGIIPCKVVELHTDELLVIEPSDTACDVVGYDMVFPIPLTAEILEKNGFKMVKYDGWVHYYSIPAQGGLPFVIHSMIGGEMLSDEVESYSTSTNDSCGIDIDYVHELQRALRCCGLWVLANNFVI